MELAEVAGDRLDVVDEIACGVFRWFQAEKLREFLVAVLPCVRDCFGLRDRQTWKVTCILSHFRRPIVMRE
ncbi:Uncharacterised protein [Mycobacteroides abscessus subsp. abscessus]|uniref:hypothetical protein n=1 Tax=Mycobacteroides abscessus TaxID=36809 RepID=UPI00092C1729|nr:hypothetical protein [Mycobacteroides abscessus]SIH22107.1 Uncharacterised protein [Mycobacteroides abscessus subsp. abscessus]